MSAAASAINPEETALGPILRNGFKSPGPKNLEYLNSTKPIVLGMGPIGCAKTSTAFMKGLVNTTRQPVRLSTGRKECKVTVVADTYKTVHNKVLATFYDLIPRGAIGSEWKGGKGEDVEVVYTWGDANGVHRTIWHFLAAGDKAVEAMTAGLRTTCVHLYEPDHLPVTAIDSFFKRLGRWPAVSDLPEGADMFTQLWGDFNAPNDTNELYRRLSLLTNPDTDHFIEWPSGFSPNAENLENLPRKEGGYYHWLAQGMRNKLEVKRMIENKVGYSRSGRPVYLDYRTDIHTANDNMVAEGNLPLIIGVDGGGSASAVICEPTFSGHLRVLDELVTPEGEFEDAAGFGEKLARILAVKYPGRAAIAAVDPANQGRNGERGANGDMKTWFLTFQTHAKIKCFPAKSNKLDIRLSAVRRLLREMIGGTPRLLVNRHCLVLREGFQSGYKLKEFKGADGTRYGERPDKGHFSHVHDALQYAAMFFLYSSDRLHEAVRSASVRHYGSVKGRKPKVRH